MIEAYELATSKKKSNGISEEKSNPKEKDKKKLKKQSISESEEKSAPKKSGKKQNKTQITDDSS